VNASSILIIRFGAMGDILHAVPAVSSLKLSFPDCRLAWLVNPKWMDLLTGNPAIDELVPFDKSDLSSLLQVRKVLRKYEFETAVDFQGLLQSAFAGRLSGARVLYGFSRNVAREPLASLLYTKRVHVTGPHRIERNLQLVEAMGAHELTRESWIPPGASEGQLPSTSYVLASPFAGWKGKEWPFDRYEPLGKRLKEEGLELVISVPRQQVHRLRQSPNVFVFSSSVPGLIQATRNATAVLGVDSGPLHLAAALKKPGVALFGPTDPAQTGPFNRHMIVLRDSAIETTYKRGKTVHPSMAGLEVEDVAQALLRSIARKPAAARNAVPIS
jgi:lipopolysaccharide heptosyltransferase I